MTLHQLDIGHSFHLQKKIVVNWHKNNCALAIFVRSLRVSWKSSFRPFTIQWLYAQHRQCPKKSINFLHQFPPFLLYVSHSLISPFILFNADSKQTFFKQGWLIALRPYHFGQKGFHPEFPTKVWIYMWLAKKLMVGYHEIVFFFFVHIQISEKYLVREKIDFQEILVGATRMTIPQSFLGQLSLNLL